MSATKTAGPAGRTATPLLQRRSVLLGVYYLFLAGLALGFLFPLIWMIGTSFKGGPESLSSPTSVVPEDPTLENYRAAFDILPTYFWNSVKLAFLNVGGLLVVASLAGFAFARLKFPGRDLIFLVVLGSALIPHIVYLIPQYVVFRDYGWVDTHYPLWVPRAMTPVFGTFLMRQFFLSIPKELEEAARIDGASTFTVFTRVMLPLAKPALATVALFTFVDSWNDLLGPLIFLNSPELQTVPVALALFQGEFFSNTPGLMAAATITILPVFAVFLLAQRYFVQGVVMSGMKG
ncbi:carbohydrate ABC transporter permease [Streptomyces sp. SBT349]|uniref:carbohydrate ABC transporter permease n=1 Tax=Streptomyces sp. SBT349 TaxID=1580539 RepID=UPI00066E58A8|nr:carbohydrate ABC transporter permease [Streptomyces sp. SBT349]